MTEVDTCRRCGKARPLSDFRMSNNGKKSYRKHVCRPCENQRLAEQRGERPPDTSHDNSAPPTRQQMQSWYAAGCRLR